MCTEDDTYCLHVYHLQCSKTTCTWYNIYSEPIILLTNVYVANVYIKILILIPRYMHTFEYLQRETTVDLY